VDHVIEEAAAQAYTNFVEDGVIPATVRKRTTQFKGVSWHKGRGKWHAACKRIFLGSHATEEAAAQAYNKYVKDGVHPVKRRDPTSQSKGVSWDKSCEKWRAKCKGKCLGYHATEEAAAQAYSNYAKDGVVPVPLRDPSCSSQFKGVSWEKRRGKWLARCKGKSQGYHATEEAAAQAYKSEAERLALRLNNIPPAGNADNNNNIGVLAAFTLPSLAAPVRAHAGAGSKRTARRAPATKQTTRMRLDNSASAAAGVAGAAAAASPTAPRPAGARQAVRLKQTLDTTAAAAGQGGY
jgi:hypothetical protein